MINEADSDTSSTSGAQQTVFLRVPAEKVSRLMDIVGELGLSVSETINCSELQGLELDEFEKSAHRLKMIVREIQEISTELRQVEVGEVFRRMRRMIRELERQTNKKINLVLIGEDLEIDKVVVDRLYEPLVHIVRNSADHGLESTANRIAVGKPEVGTITLSATQVGGDINIIIADDGGGLHRERILARARERGLFGATEEPPNDVLWKVIFQPGFSTAEAVTNLSGRGVGMDVLNNTIKELRGRIAIHSETGVGARVTLSIPLTLAFLDSLVMRVGNRLYATPIDVVSEIFQPLDSQITHISADDSSEVVKVRDCFIPICRLDEFYGEATQEKIPLISQIIVIFTTSQGQIGLPVDEIFDQQQVVMKPLPPSLGKIRASMGCALLGTGEVATVLDCEQLISGKT
ncbi:MAG: chemotaxis protein CheW [Methylococcales bacterium]